MLHHAVSRYLCKANYGCLKIRRNAASDNLIICMQIAATAGAHLADLGQGEFDDRGGSPARNTCYFSEFFIDY